MLNHLALVAFRVIKHSTAAMAQREYWTYFQSVCNLENFISGVRDAAFRET